MKSILIIFTILAFALRSPGQTNEPVRVALVSESDEASAVVDVLTAELSGHKNLQLLERSEIEKAYREQGLSAGNTDYLKLGQILGADGLLLLDVVRTPQTTNLMARLIAVKPGVILTDGSFAWPLKDTTQWAESVSSYLDLLLPKLSVPAKDAIPISVVNLRSSVASAEGAETERQLKLLTIQRLSQEKELFVLERQKMQLLSEEKELKADDSAFWNGSYLLEGVVDQNGYSQDTVTINARLTPSKGGTPLLMEVSGSRTNFAEVINQLADKVNKVLKLSSAVREWNAADEAAQYFAEAQWALRWGAYAEAQAAAESAWALGRRDVTSAMLRVRTYMVSPDAGKMVIYYPPKERPDTQNIDFALRALEIYNESSRNFPPEEPKVDSDWYRLGLENLTVASRVLQVFNWSPEFYRPVAGKLAELRMAARSTAGWISRSPSVHDSYFVGDRVVPYDDLYHFEENPSIFSVQLDCGCLWQETPEDCLALYRELMGSPVFCYLHDRLWFRDGYHRSALRLLPPRLIAWNESDQKRIPIVWGTFIDELNNSPNLLLQLEAKATCLADSTNETEMAGAFTNFFSTMFLNRDALVANSVDVLYLEWWTGDLVERMGGDIDIPTKESLQQLYNSEYRPKLEAMHQEYQDKTIPARQTAFAFEKQKQYLASFTPYDFQTFQQTFASRSFTKAQAAELLPLIAAYKSNLLAQASSAPEKFKAQSDAQWIAFSFEKGVNEILNPPAPRSVPVQIQTSKPTAIAQMVVPVPVDANAPEIATNILLVSKFMKVPLEDLYVLEENERVESSSATLTAHHWIEGKLLLDFQFGIVIVLRDGKGGYLNVRNEAGPAIAIFDPATEHWDVIGSPKVDIMAQNRSYNRSTLWRGELFNCDGGQIKKYDSADRQWEVLPVSDGGNYELFTVNDRLYAANGNMIVEIMEDDKSTRILASTRRQPPVSALDSEDWGAAALFEGPANSLRVCTKSKIFTWTGNDWHEDGATPPASTRPEIFPDGLLFRQEGFFAAGYQNGVITRRENGTYGDLHEQDGFSILANNANLARLCLKGNHDEPRSFSRPGSQPVQTPGLFWEMPVNMLPRLPAALRQADLYVLEDNFAAHAIVNQRHEIAQEDVVAGKGYNAALLCFSHDFPSPQKMFLKLDDSGVKTFNWMTPTTDRLIFGLENADRLPGMVANDLAGIWVLPFSQLDPAIASQKQLQIVQHAQAETQTRTAAENARTGLLAKYDHNHNGIIDPDEIEAALDDPAFIESELDLIDTNHNGWLDAVELIYFDANTDKTLEPKEQAGIEIAQHLLAERLLKKFDANGDGSLNRSEFNDLVQSSPDAHARPSPGFSFQVPDENHDGMVDQAELEVFLKQQLRKELRPRGVMGAAYFNQMMMESKQRVDANQSFKAYVELFWQNSGGITNKPPDHKTE